MIPEVSGFLLAAIAGGVVSRAFASEKFMSKGFKNVLKDASVLLIIAIAFILVAAFLETFVSARIVYSIA
jgi:ribose/xylose/arabinose/galactoside ABC-type transport system permease subunit